MKKQTCIICRKPLNDGIILYGRGICSNCEQKLISTDMKTDFYNHYNECIKRNLSQLLLRGEENSWQNYHL